VEDFLLSNIDHSRGNEACCVFVLA
jgi:hypothetical protein